MSHRHKVEDTRARSLLKALTAKVAEILVDTLLVGSVLNYLHIPRPYELAGGFAVAIEVMCFITSYIVDRLWNKIQWGRRVEEIDKETSSRDEAL